MPTRLVPITLVHHLGFARHGDREQGSLVGKRRGLKLKEASIKYIKVMVHGILGLTIPVREIQEVCVQSLLHATRHDRGAAGRCAIHRA